MPEETLTPAEAGDTTRQTTPAGMLRASAIVTRAGMFPYDAADIGAGKKGKTVMVERPVSSVRDPKTMASIRGAPVTLGHPSKDVTPDTWKDVVVGHVVGEPRVDSLGNVTADIMVGRPDAIAAIQGGVEELSIGYKFQYSGAPEKSTADVLTRGPLEVNHVAIVPRGRSGPGVRILDEATGETAMDEAQITAIVEKALNDHLGSASATDSAPVDVGSLTQVITASVLDAITPIIERAAALEDGLEEAEDEEEKAEMMAQAHEAAANLIIDATLAERDRSRILHDAVQYGMLKPESAADMVDDPVGDIAVAILKDAMPNIDDRDPQYVRGVLDSLLAMKQPGTASSPGIPTGVGIARDASGPGLNPESRSSAAYDEYVKTFQWQEPGEKTAA